MNKPIHGEPVPPWLYEDVARHMGVSERTVRRWVREGIGPRAVRVGNTVRFRQEDVAAWLNERLAA